jgi:Fe-S oxidoreductase
MATLKAEYLYQKYRKQGFPLRSRAFAAIDRLNAIGSHFPGISNFFLQSRFFSGILKKGLSVAPQRSLPTLSQPSFSRWWKKVGQHLPIQSPLGRTVHLFCDEFTQYNDAEIGEHAVRLLKGLGYEVLFVEHAASGRAHISKGLLDGAQQLAQQNVQLFAPLVSAERPLLGIEPSAILGFQDEYPRLLRGKDQELARQLAPHTMLMDTFLAREAAAGHISTDAFTREKRSVLLHGHCHQKALADAGDSAFILSLPEHYTVSVIPSGCCGMAGSFGYEQEHYELSMQVGEETLFPSVRGSTTDTIIAAPGTSCRHQIVDGTERKALHPVSILWGAFQQE